MLKKAKAELAAGETDQAKGLAKSVLDSSHQIWLAGLGAFAKAQQGGAKLYEGLVKQGEGVEAKTRKVAAQTAEAARDAAKTKAKEMQAMAGGTWDKLEQVFENRVARALGRLGVYSSSDVERLTERVDELTEAVNALLKAQGIKRRPPASPVRKMVKGAVRTATRSAARTVASATGTAAKTVSGATRTAQKTLRTASKIAKATLK
jgi:poly(hydroxyalkanoate) granule-associated protein